MQLGRILAGEVQQNELIVADLYDRGDGEIRIFGGLCFGVIHLENVARDAVGAIGGLLIHVHEHNIDIDHGTHSHWLQSTSTRAHRTGTPEEATPFQLIEQCEAAAAPSCAHLAFETQRRRIESRAGVAQMQNRRGESLEEFARTQIISGIAANAGAARSASMSHKGTVLAVRLDLPARPQ